MNYDEHDEVWGGLQKSSLDPILASVFLRCFPQPWPENPPLISLKVDDFTRGIFRTVLGDFPAGNY
jgi:hypothetical protein